MAYNATQHQNYADSLRDWARRLAQLKIDADELRFVRQHVINGGVAGTLDPPIPGAGDFWLDTADYTTTELEDLSTLQSHLSRFLTGDATTPITQRMDDLANFSQV